MFVVLWLAGASGAIAANPTSAELAAVRARIADVQKRLENDQGERDELRRELRASERDVGALTFALRELEAGVRVEAAALARTQAQSQRQSELLRAQRSALAQQIRVAYQQNARGGDTLQLFLQQQDPAQVARFWVYHGYYSRARAAQMTQLRTQLGVLQRLRSEAAQRHAELARLRADQSHKRAQLLQSQRRKTTLLASLTQRIAGQRDILTDLRADAARLGRLVVDVQRAVADLPLPPAASGPFGRAKGRLSPPLRGRLKVGTRDARWKGILLSAPVGGEVLAVHTGRVVFADWLRGFGLLLILEHGDGYMTLYGHNQSLFKRVGDTVAPGDVVAVAGNTGGFAEPGLYFEIRHHGEARNPLEWLARR